MCDIENFACGGVSKLSCYGSDSTTLHMAREVVSYNIVLSWQVFHLEIEFLEAQRPLFQFEIFETLGIQPLQSCMVCSEAKLAPM